LAVALVLPTVSLTASLASATAPGPGTVGVVATAPVALRQPRDGRVNGDGFAAEVVGYRFAHQLSTGALARRAAPGQVFLAFGVTSDSRAVSARLLVDGHAERLPGFVAFSAVYPTYYLASVPEKAADVVLELSRDGFAQEFSFTKGVREGAQPSVLYESATDWEQSATFTGENKLSVLGPGGHVQETAHQVLTVSVALTYFLPGSHAVPGALSRAWLVLDGDALGYYTTSRAGLPDLAYTRALAGKDMTLTLPGSGPMAARTTGATGKAGPGLFSGSYYWQVPATIRTATVRLSLPPLVASGPGSAGARGRLVTTARPVQLSFLPSPYQGPGTGGSPAPPSTLGPAPAGRTASGRTGKPATGTDALVLIMLIAVVLAILGSYLWLGRRGFLPAWAPLGRRAGRASPPGGYIAQSTADVAEPPSLGGDGAPGPAPLGPAATSEPLPLFPPSRGPVLEPPLVPPSGVTGPAPEGPATLLEGAMLQMIGHVRLVRWPEPAEPSTELPGLPPLAVDQPSGPTPPAAHGQTASSASPSGPLAEPPPDAPSVPVPEGPPPLAEGAMELQVIGPPRLVAEPGGTVELGSSELELLARLALEPGRTFSSEELRADIGAAKETDWAPTTLWSRASSLRQVVGLEHLPSGTKAGGYRVVGIGTDVARFEAAVACAKAGPAEAARHLAAALSLVRGAPFANVTAGSFGWALQAGGLATRVTNGIYEAAAMLTRAAAAAGDSVLATWAVGKGRLVSRQDELWDELELDAAAVSPDRSALPRAWADVSRRHRGARKKVPERLVEHYRRLSERGASRG